MREHAFLSASSAHRWLNCTKAPVLEQTVPDTTNIYAEEGSLAHEIAELILRAEINSNDFADIAEYEEFMSELKNNELFYEGMLNEIDIYTTYCIERYHEFKAKDKLTVIAIEQKLDFSKYVPEGFGTGDCVIIGDNKIEVIDLKFGKGVEVEVENNPQLMLYGLGALEAFDFLYNIEEVILTVAQVRLGGISSWSISAKDLKAWGEEVVKEKAILAFNGKGETVPGDWCMFCKFKGQCKARSQYLKKIYEMHKEKEKESLSLDELSDILKHEKLIKDWLKDVTEYALQLALSGIKIPGFKVVEGRSNRKIVDEEGLAELLISLGYPEEKIYKPKEINTITALEKLVGKKEFEELSAGYVEKPEGKPTLVEDSDRRESIVQTVEDEFDFK